MGASYNSSSSAQVIGPINKILSRDSYSPTIGASQSSGSGFQFVQVVEPARTGMMFETGQNYRRSPSDDRTGSIGDTGSVEYLQSSSANIVESTPSGAGGGSSDPKYHTHTYASLLEFQQPQPGSTSLGTAAGGQSLTTGVGGGSAGTMLACVYSGGQLPDHSLELNEVH